MSTSTTNNESSIPTHQEYEAVRPLWDQMRVTTAGEYAVKNAGSTYLPMTSGQSSDKVNGTTHYNAYKQRAVYYEFLRDTQTDMIGMLTAEPTVFKVPGRLDKYLTNASKEGEGIRELERRIYDEQLVPSRGGLLLEVAADEGTETTPVSVLYSAERIVNWDDENTPPRWIVLDESHKELKGGTLARKDVTEYLLLALNAADEYYTYRFKTWPDGFDMANPPAEASEEEAGELDTVAYPRVLGKTISTIPFTFFNATTITPSVELPVLLPLSNLTLSVYRGEADYRQTLFMQGQETLFLKGFAEKERAGIKMGASSFFGSNNPEADARFVGISAAGLSEARESQESLKVECKNLGVELVENGAESGAALNTRLTIRTASLSDIARVCAAAIQQQIEYAAQWLDLSDAEKEEIEVNASADFTRTEQDTKAMLELWAAVQQGGMTMEDYHAWLSENDFTSMQFDEWQDQVQATGGLALGDFTTGIDGNGDE